jgi:hypothetical protein
MLGSRIVAPSTFICDRGRAIPLVPEVRFPHYQTGGYELVDHSACSFPTERHSGRKISDAYRFSYAIQLVQSVKLRQRKFACSERLLNPAVNLRTHYSQ